MKTINFNFTTKNIATAVGIPNESFNALANKLADATYKFAQEKSSPGTIAKWLQENLSEEEVLLIAVKQIFQTIDDCVTMQTKTKKALSNIDSIEDFIDQLSGKKSKKVKKSKKKNKKDDKLSDLLEKLTNPGNGLHVIKMGGSKEDVFDVIAKLKANAAGNKSFAPKSFEELEKEMCSEKTDSNSENIQSKE